VVDEDPGQGGRRGRSKIDSSDPRALRTRSKLVGAFHVAIARSDPSAMSVSSLTQAAGVNRTSFYGHFSGHHACLRQRSWKKSTRIECFSSVRKKVSKIIL
jgi:AcrR family transcriptional regulator